MCLQHCIIKTPGGYRGFYYTIATVLPLFRQHQVSPGIKLHGFALGQLIYFT